MENTDNPAMKRLSAFVGEWSMETDFQGAPPRVYEMSFSAGVWKLWREPPDFSQLNFSQRFTGIFSAEDATIACRWESSSEESIWEHDFDLTYTRVGGGPNTGSPASEK